MTKKEKRKIQELEINAWNWYANTCEKSTDETSKRDISNIWFGIINVMEALGIEKEVSERRKKLKYEGV